MKTKLQKNKLILGLLICIGAGLLFGTIEIIDAIKIDIIYSEERYRWDCEIKDEQTPPCPYAKQKMTKPFNSSEQIEKPFNDE